MLKYIKLIFSIFYDLDILILEIKKIYKNILIKFYKIYIFENHMYHTQPYFVIQQCNSKLKTFKHYLNLFWTKIEFYIL
jgi:hypothetical protein